MIKKTNKTKSLARGSAIYGIGNIGTLAINFFLVPLYTFYLSTNELGFFDVVASALVVIAPLFFGHIELAVIRWVLTDNNISNIKRVVSNCFAIFILGQLAFTLVYFGVNIFVEWEYSAFIYLYFSCNFFNIIAKQLIRSVYSSLHYVMTELVYTLLVLLFIIFFIEELKLKAIFVAYGLATTALLVYLLVLNIGKRISFKTIKWSFAKELLAYSTPLIPNTFSLWLNNMSNKYLIVFFIGLSANGIYAIAFKFAYVLQILNRIFYYSFQDKMYAMYGKNGYKNYFSTTFDKYSTVLFSILFLLIGSQKVVLPFVVDSAFHEAMLYIPILGLGVLFMSLATIIGIIYQCEKKNIFASKTSFVSGLFIVVAGALAIPRFGLYGASVAFMVGNLILLSYRFIDTQKYISRELPYIRFIIYIFIGTGLWGISMVDDIKAHILAFALAIIIALFLNFRQIKKYLLALRIKLGV